MRVDQETFVSTLAKLLKTAESTGSVYLEQKRLSRTGEDAQLTKTSSPYSLVFRATDGVKDKKKRTKISTIVAADELEAFWVKYTDALKSGMPGLMKKEKKKAKK